MDINSGTGGGVVWIAMSEIGALEDKWEVQLNEVEAIIDGDYMFSGWIWFRSRMECVGFSENHIPVGKFQWFLDIISYLQFVTGGMVLTL